MDGAQRKSKKGWETDSPVLHPNSEYIPDELKQLPRWVCWSGDWKNENGKPKLTKRPIDPKTGRFGSHSDSHTWGTFEQAWKWHTSNPNKSRGIGFVFNGDGICGIDLDDCIVDGQLAPWACELLTDLGDTYVEKSPGGTGLKAFVRGTLPVSGANAGSIEMYATTRFFTVTGLPWELMPYEIGDCPDLPTIYKKWIVDKKETKIPRPSPPRLIPDDRAELVKRARNYVAKMDPAISGQKGHNQTLKVACRLVGLLGLTETEAWDVLWEYNDRCEPSWGDKELRHKLTDALKKVGESGQLTGMRPAVAATKKSSEVKPDKQYKLASEIKIERVEWLYKWRIPKGMVTLLSGNPKVGKSFLGLEIAARLTRGRKMPPDSGTDEAAKPVKALIVNGEDDLARVVVPRLKALDADLEKVVLLADLPDGEYRRPVVLPDDLPILEEIIVEQECQYVLIDTLSAFLSAKIDTNKNADIRGVLYRFKQVAEKTGAAFVVIDHLNKMSSERNAMYRNSGSIGMVGAARSLLLVGCSPKLPGASVLCSVGSNLGLSPPSLAFRIEPVGDCAILSWVGEVDLGPEDLLDPPSPRHAVKRESAKEFLQKQLEKGPKLVEEIMAAAKQLGISGKTLRLAKEELNIRKNKLEFSGKCQWSLPKGPDKQTEGQVCTDGSRNQAEPYLPGFETENNRASMADTIPNAVSTKEGKNGQVCTGSTGNAVSAILAPEKAEGVSGDSDTPRSPVTNSDGSIDF